MTSFVKNISMHFLDELNKSQRKAAEHLYGATMVIAGAGSGKTRVLTYRIAYMIENEIDPFNVLALTFTNKAAREMTERIGSIIFCISPTLYSLSEGKITIMSPLALFMPYLIELPLPRLFIL